jgi:hypothetical protein
MVVACREATPGKGARMTSNDTVDVEPAMGVEYDVNIMRPTAAGGTTWYGGGGHRINHHRRAPYGGFLRSGQPARTPHPPMIHIYD